MAKQLSSKQIRLATGLIKENGYELKEFNDRHTLKLEKKHEGGRTTKIYLFPPKN